MSSHNEKEENWDVLRAWQSVSDMNIYINSKINSSNCTPCLVLPCSYPSLRRRIEVKPMPARVESLEASHVGAKGEIAEAVSGEMKTVSYCES